MIDAAGKIRDLSGVMPDIAREALSPESLKKLSTIDASRLPMVEGTPRIGPCVGSVGKFVCIGLNYSDHAAESGMKVQAEPVLFMKATSAICGPNDKVVIPRGAEKADWEVELGVVIGKEAKYVDEREALSYVAGFCVVNGSGKHSRSSSFSKYSPPLLLSVLAQWVECSRRRCSSEQASDFCSEQAQTICSAIFRSIPVRLHSSGWVHFSLPPPTLPSWRS